MKRKFLPLIFIVFGTLALFNACKKDKGETNEEEVITTLEVKVTETGTNTSTTFKYDDPDGPGGANATIEPIVLTANKTYDVTVAFLNKTKNPVQNITDEVREEADEHRIYYEVAPGTNVTVSNLDNDANGIPVGLSSRWATGAAAVNGNINITLRHFANKGKMISDPVDSPKSSTDISTKDIGGFVVRIQ
jgi:hypothetical protein